MNPQTPSSRQVLLGVFILGQLIFLLSGNLIGFLKDNRAEMSPQARRVVEVVAPGWPDEKGHFWHLLEHAAKADKLWAQATGQFQTWSLFAPTISRECVFPAMDLRWDDEPSSALGLARALALLSANNPLEAACLGKATAAHANTTPGPELVLSENEPVNLEQYLRIGNYRLRRYENNLVIVLRPDDKETPKETNERWSESIRSHVADYADILQGYLRWRVGKALAQWPGRGAPRQAILVLRRFHINDYEAAPPIWDGPHAVPVARWQPGATWDASHLPLEWYDPVSQHFKALPK